MKLRSLTLATLAFLAIAIPGRADDVHLTNGNTFEGVVARVEGAQVVIRLPQGELTLPLSKVARIERQASPLEEYLERERILDARETTSAAEWLALARWADERGLEHGARKSAVAAARRDPGLAGIADILEPLGWVYDPDLGRWLSRDEHLRRRGWVTVGGRWMSPEEQETRARAAELERQRYEERRRDAIAELALETAIEARVQAEVAREVATQPVYPNFGIPVVLGTTFFPLLPRDPHLPPPHVQRREIDPPAREQILQRDFGGSLGRGPAPGRLGGVRRSGTSSPR